MENNSSASTCVTEVTSAISRMKFQPNTETTNITAVGSVPGSMKPSTNRDSNPNSLKFTQHPDSPLKQKLTTSVQIPIIGYEVMEERARFTVYKLRVDNKSSGDCWLVFRRYTDFVRLHSKLKSEFPNIKLPLPRKRWFGDNFDPNFLNERIMGLQGFVNEILRHQEIFSAPCIKDFFCLDEPPSYAESMEESKAIFEALEETIFHLRSQVKEKEMELCRLRDCLESEIKQKNSLHQIIEDVTNSCKTCSELLKLKDDLIVTSSPLHSNRLEVKDNDGNYSVPLVIQNINENDSCEAVSLGSLSISLHKPLANSSAIAQTDVAL